MQIEELLQKARDSVDVREVFGEPYERDGVTVIPMARVSGGGGSGSGPMTSGGGSGFGFKAEPAGAYVIRGDKVRWEDAVNVNRIVTGAFVVGALSILITPRILKQLRKLFR